MLDWWLDDLGYRPVAQLIPDTHTVSSREWTRTHRRTVLRSAGER